MDGIINSILTLGLLFLLAIIGRGLYSVHVGRQLKAQQAAREARQLAAMENYFKRTGQTEASPAAAGDTEPAKNNTVGNAQEPVRPVAQPGDEAANTTPAQGRELNTASVLADAENHIRYDRMGEAARVLQRAINHAPHRVDLRLKLVEVFAATGNEAGLTQQELDLTAIGDRSAIAYCRGLIEGLAKDAAGIDKIAL